MNESAKLNMLVKSYRFSLPPPLFAASMSAVWNTVLGQGRGTNLSESPITENTMVGVDLTASLIAFHVDFTSGEL